MEGDGIVVFGGGEQRFVALHVIQIIDQCALHRGCVVTVRTDYQLDLDFVVAH